MEEEWKDITHFDGFQVSNDGRVRNKHGRILKGSVNNNGYQMVHLRTKDKNKLCTVHRLVAEAFISNPDNLPQINHKDENKANNSVENLEWCTGKYNVNYGTRNERAGKIRGYMVYCVELNKTFNSMVEAEKETGAKQIAKACRGIYSHSGGYHWKFVER